MSLTDSPATPTPADDAVLEKLAALEAHLADVGPMLIAFSGGVDSTFLAAAAYRALGPRALAVTVDMSAMATGELDRAKHLAAQIGITHQVITVDQLAVEGFCENSSQRCYHCKVVILQALKQVAREHGLDVLAEGSNADDVHDFRPGHVAVKENHGHSPLQEIRWTKAEIRAASRLLGLDSADTPSAACLASRIPYGQRITDEKLRQVDAVETWLHQHGIDVCRARHHGDVLRVEVAANALAELLDETIRKGLVDCAHRAGFKYAAIDLEPYAMGRLNS